MLERRNSVQDMAPQPSVLLRSLATDSNISMLYAELVEEIKKAPAATVLVESDEPAGFFQVAIDCPGYGRSEGSMSIIRASPAALVADVVRSLGKQHAFALAGSSQGACAVFDALLERPGLANFAVVREPFGRDIGRYTNMLQPALLVVDRDDERHPLKTAKQIGAAIPQVPAHHSTPPTTTTTTTSLPPPPPPPSPPRSRSAPSSSSRRRRTPSSSRRRWRPR